MAAFLGIDFSGSAAQWRTSVSRPSVWIAQLESDGATGFRLAGLRPVQDLPGSGNPFDRLVDLLAEGSYVAAGIDAPFSLPVEQCPPGGRKALLRAVLALQCEDRPFPSGPDLIRLAEGVRPWRAKKPLRPCEEHWAQRRVNVRSTLWWKPRGGAPFAAACLTLLARAGRPCWPWDPVQEGLLVEAFPAGQLRAWGLSPNGYSGDAPTAQAARALIVEAVENRIALPGCHRATMEGSADALDAVLAAFGAVAVGAGRLASEPGDVQDGWIAVMA